MKFSAALILIIASMQAIAEQAHDQFFQKFVRNMHQQDASLSELYADNAKIERITSSSQGIEEIINLDGTRYKKLIQISKGKNILAGNSDFSSVDFFTNRSRVAIKANRYSRSQCFTDRSYYIVIDKQPNGEYKIVHERIEKTMQNLCSHAIAAGANPPQKTLIKQNNAVAPALQQQNIATIIKQKKATSPSHASLNQAAMDFANSRTYNLSYNIKLIATNLRGKLPLTIDKNTLLTSYKHTQSTITFNYKIQKYQTNKKYDLILEEIYNQHSTRVFCSDIDTKKMLDHDGTIIHNYKDTSNNTLFNFSITKKSCTK